MPSLSLCVTSIYHYQMVLSSYAKISVLPWVKKPLSLDFASNYAYILRICMHIKKN